jgi:hypothetical protein
MKLNPVAVEKAKQLLDDGKFRISTPWREVRPSSEVEDRYLNQHGTQEYAEWYLAIDPAAPAGSRARYQYPIGDFNAVHRSGLVAAKELAAKYQQQEIEAAADDLLFLFDRLTAC